MTNDQCSIGGEQVSHRGGDRFGREVGERAATARRTAGGLEDSGGAAENGARANRIRRSEGRDEWDAESVGEVHAAGVVCDEQSQRAELGGEVEQGGLSRQVF